MNFLYNFHLLKKERDWEIKMQQNLFFSDSYALIELKKMWSFINLGFLVYCKKLLYASLVF